MAPAAHAAVAQPMPTGLPAGIQPLPLQPETGRVETRVPVQVPAPGDDRPVLVPTTREYQWIFRVPVFVVEHRRVALTAPSVSMHSRRWNYEMPALRGKRMKLWDVPEFSCKYPDLMVPNECRTVWHGVYVDAPVLVSERATVDVDVPRFAMTEQFIKVEVLSWTWTDKSFRFSLPAVAPAETVQQLRMALNGQRANLAAATDETIASITREIETLRAAGEDPSRLVSDDGSSLDLLAELQSLRDQRAQELERLAAIDAELTQLSAR